MVDKKIVLRIPEEKIGFTKPLSERLEDIGCKEIIGSVWGEGVIVRDAEGNVFRARLVESLDEKPNHWIQISNPPSIKWYKLYALGWVSEINPGLEDVVYREEEIAPDLYGILMEYFLQDAYIEECLKNNYAICDFKGIDRRFNPVLQFLQGLCAVWQCPVSVHHSYPEKVVVVEMTAENYLYPFQDMDTMFLRTMGKVGEFIQWAKV